MQNNLFGKKVDIFHSTACDEEPLTVEDRTKKNSTVPPQGPPPGVELGTVFTVLIVTERHQSISGLVHSGSVFCTMTMR
jgi:hypothetical protein